MSFGGANGLRAFLWKDGEMKDLNALVGTGSLDVLVSAQDIDDAGQITGRVLEGDTGETLAFVATPIPSPRPDRSAAAASSQAVRTLRVQDRGPER